MRFSFLELIRNIATRSRDPQVRKHSYILLICLGISIFIWLMIKMSKNYYANVECRIEYSNLPPDKLIDSADSLVNMEVYAQGFRLFSIKYLSDNPKIEVDLKNTKIQKHRYKYGSYVLSSELVSSIAAQLEIENEIVEITPDTINFVLEEMMSKEIPVKPNLQISFKKQYQLDKAIEVKPASIKVSGLPSFVDTMRFVPTQKVMLTEINESKNLNVPLKKPPSNARINYNRDSVQLIIPVEKYTEASIQVPLKIKSNGKRVKLFPEEVTITYLVAISDYNKVNADMFTALADFSNITPGSRTVRVKLSHSPKFVRIIHLKPEKVEFIYLK